MTAVTVNEISVIDIPTSLASGQGGKRRQIVLIRATAANADQTLNMAAYIPNIDSDGGILGVIANSVAGAVSSTAITWSTNTLTFAQSKGATGGEATVGLVIELN